MLCRPFLKGRDWYDFSWYVKQSVQPNLPHLQSALLQWGPWEGQDVIIDLEWLKHTLTEKINTINWQNATVDVERFLAPLEQHSLKLWDSRFFLNKVKQL